MRANWRVAISVGGGFVVFMAAGLGAIYLFLSDHMVDELADRSQVAGTFLSAVAIVAGFITAREVKHLKSPLEPAPEPMHPEPPRLTIGKEDGKLGEGDPKAVADFIRAIQALPRDHRTARVTHPLLADKEFQKDQQAYYKLCDATARFESYATSLLREDVLYNVEPTTADMAGALSMLWVMCGGSQGMNYVYWNASPPGGENIFVPFTVLTQTDDYRNASARLLNAHRRELAMHSLEPTLVWTRVVPYVIVRVSSDPKFNPPVRIDDWLIRRDVPGN